MAVAAVKTPRTAITAAVPKTKPKPVNVIVDEDEGTIASFYQPTITIREYVTYQDHLNNPNNAANFDFVNDHNTLNLASPIKVKL